MPDHEEAVREAREKVDWRFESIYAERGRQALDGYEAAIRASERVKYAALVEAARRVLLNVDSADSGLTALYRALAALQSKEGNAV